VAISTSGVPEYQPHWKNALPDPSVVIGDPDRPRTVQVTGTPAGKLLTWTSMNRQRGPWHLTDPGLVPRCPVASRFMIRVTVGCGGGGQAVELPTTAGDGDPSSPPLSRAWTTTE